MVVGFGPHNHTPWFILQNVSGYVMALVIFYLYMLVTSPGYAEAI